MMTFSLYVGHYDFHSHTTHVTLQLMTTYSNLQKQLSMLVSAPIAKEGKRIEASLGRNMERSIKANIDAMWARFQEENARHEKSERERMQQMATLIATSVNKDIPVMLEKSLKKEISSLGPAVARATAPIIEKSLSSAVSDSLQVVAIFSLDFFPVISLIQLFNSLFRKCWVTRLLIS